MVSFRHVGRPGGRATGPRGPARPILSALLLVAIGIATPAHGAMERVAFGAFVEAAQLRSVLIARIFRDGAHTARAWDDETGCNHLTLSDPELRPSAGGDRLLLRMHAEGRAAWKVAGYCSFPFDWSGTIALDLEPTVERESGRLAFEIRAVSAEDAQGRAQPIEGVLRDWIRDRVEPRFAELRLAAEDLLPGLGAILPEFVPGPVDDAAVARRMVDSIAFERAAVRDAGLDVEVDFEVEAAAPHVPGRGGTPGSPAERAASAEESLRRIDAFITFVAASTADESASPGVREDLLGALLEERHATVDEFAAGPPEDPAAASRRVFTGSWARLAPLLRRAAVDLPTEAQARYASFLAAGDALQAIGRLGDASPLELTTDGLRMLARRLAPDAEGDPLESDAVVDPRLRAIFGFGAPLPRATPVPDPVPAKPLAEPPTPPVRPEQPGDPVAAAGGSAPPTEGVVPTETPPPSPTPSPDPRSRLERWVPTVDDAAAYLATAAEALRADADAVAADDAARGAKPALARELRRELVAATAWQRSCWRFWIQRGDVVVARTSPTGGVGWLGVDARVWRGFFDREGLRSDPDYNARAGAEILARLASPGLRASSGDSTEPGTAEDPLRVGAEVYALYDGGPALLRRLREGRADAVELDDSRAFREKLVRVRAGGLPSVAECFEAPPSPTPVPPAVDGAVGAESAPRATAAAATGPAAPAAGPADPPLP